MLVLEPSDILRFSNTAYHALTAATLPRYLSTHHQIAELLGGTHCDWQAEERGDGNLNLVFIVSGLRGQVVVKQALPYVRMVGDSWPLALSRAHFEQAALRRQCEFVPALVPAVYAVDSTMALTVMEYLTPHVVLRKGFVAGIRYPHVGEHLGQFLAGTLFGSSDLNLSADEKKRRVAEFAGNTAMCKITEDLIFDEPYFEAPLNRHTAPGLNACALEFRRDIELKLAVQAMKWRFLNHAECLLHGDLHTGSVMVSGSNTRVIDPEFAFYGPMGFDLGLLFANFMMAYLSQAGHETERGERREYGNYLLEQMERVWTSFCESFTSLWFARSKAAPGGDLLHPRLLADAALLNGRALQWHLQRLWQDALGFAGCEIIRRILGLAHVEDFESIADLERRAACELKALSLGRDLLLGGRPVTSMPQLLHAVQASA